MYATYEDYTGTYYGTLIAEAEWNRYEQEAAAYVDRLTYDRLISYPEKVTDSVKKAVCAVADVLKRQDDAEAEVNKHLGINSFSNSGYSESYSSPQSIKSYYDSQKLDAVDLWLPRSDPLRYAGVYDE